MILLSCYVLFLLCGMVDFGGKWQLEWRVEVLKSESGEEGNSFSVSWVLMVFRADAYAGNRQKQ